MWVGMTAAFLATTPPAWMCIRRVSSLKTFFAMFAVGCTMVVVSWILMWLVWVYGVGLPYPMPLIGPANALWSLAGMVVTLWFQFPKAWRQEKSFQSQMKWLFVALGVILTVNMEYWVLGLAFQLCPADYQWILAIGITFFMELNVRLLSKVFRDKQHMKKIGRSIMFLFSGRLPRLARPPQKRSGLVR